MKQEEEEAFEAAVAASQANATKWSGVTRQDLEGALTAVAHGYDPVAAGRLIEYFHDQNLQPNGRDVDLLLALVRHAFQRIVVDKKSADVAFGLALGRGEYERDFTVGRDVAAVAYVILLVRNGWNWLDAKGEAANHLFPDGRGDGAVDKAYRAYHAALQHTPDQFLMDLLPPGTVLI